MKEHRHKKRNIIPIGIFLILFLFMIIISGAISTAYFYIEAKTRIAEIEKYTRNYSIPLAEAMADVVELSYKDKDLDNVKRIFREKIQANVIDEGFFVLSDGKVVVHSVKEIEKELNGNIATDEFAYNLDLIMLPAARATNAQFMDYNIYKEKKELFNKRIIKVLKKYIYSKIDISGWLATRAVYVNGKAIGCVSFIISKERIYKFLVQHFRNTIILSIILSIISLILSFMISSIVYIRYRSLNKINSVRNETKIKCEKTSSETDFMNLAEKKLKEAIKVKSESAENIKINKVNSLAEKIIKDAIPAGK